MPADDASLLRAMHAGDAAAADALWSAHAPRLTALVHAMMRGAGAASRFADDAVQTVFLRVLSLDSDAVDAIRDVRAYLTQAARAAALNARRAESRESARREALSARPSGAFALPEGLDDLVANLPEPQREVVLLKHVAGLTFDQISLVTGEPRATLASRHAAALKSLRTALQPAPGATA